MSDDSARDGTAGGRPASLVPSVPQLVDRFTNLWVDSGTGCPDLGRTFTSKERAPREKALARFADALLSETKRLPLTLAAREACQKRIFAAFDQFARQALDWEDRHLDALIGGGFDRGAADFVRMAKEIDPGVSSGDLFQACRNVWVANGLQKLLGLPVRLTPPVLAYSLLYPLTDNYLDDPGTPEDTKQSFSSRLRSRLAGAEAAPANPREKAIFELVGMIEAEYDREREPQVFESLLAIHQAQVRSLRLLRADGPQTENEIAAISLEKGGTSVLADGCLAAGHLAPGEVEFLFGFGAFLQLMDDLEDVDEDREAGLRTVFSRAAGREPLDLVTDRLFRFGVRVLESLDGFGVPEAQPLRELIRSSLRQGVVTTAGRFERLYTGAYLRALEVHSPFRFSFNNRQRRKLLRRRAAFTRLFESLSMP